MKSILRVSAIVLIICTLSIGLFILSTKIPMGQSDESSQPQITDIESESLEESIEPSYPPRVETVVLKAAGDNLIHDNFYKQANARAGGNGYDFDPPYERVKPLISGGDITFINQETPLAEEKFELSGYPRFNSPNAVGDKLCEMGFNVVTYANNHMFDMGEEGLLAHMDFWDSKPDVLGMGAWRNEASMEKPILLTKNDITFGFVPMTEHTNGLKLPIDTPIRFIRTDEWDLIKKQLDLINSSSDFQIVSVHWGVENSIESSQEQREFAKKLADNGVDLIIGHHSHTLQPMEWIETENGNRVLVCYSLGNFVSSMLNPQNMLGGILEAEIKKDFESGKTEIVSAKMYPIVTQYDGSARKEVRIYPLSEYTEELAFKHGVHAGYGEFGLDYLNNIVKKNIPQEFLEN